MEVILASLIEGAGLATFMWFLIRGLNAKITALEGTVSAQKQTIEAMEKRVSETEKIGDLYRKLLSNLPEDIDNYNKMIAKLKYETISELEAANQHKDSKLKELKEAELRALSVAEEAVGEIPALRDELVRTLRALQDRLEVVEDQRLVSPGTSALQWYAQTRQRQFGSGSFSVNRSAVRRILANMEQERREQSDADDTQPDDTESSPAA